MTFLRKQLSHKRAETHVNSQEWHKCQAKRIPEDKEGRKGRCSVITSSSLYHKAEEFNLKTDFCVFFRLGAQPLGEWRQHLHRINHFTHEQGLEVPSQICTVSMVSLYPIKLIILAITAYSSIYLLLWVCLLTTYEPKLRELNIVYMFYTLP